MIVTSDNQPSKRSLEQKIQAQEPEVAPNEPPPSYSAHTESGSSSISLPTFKSKPTNFLSLSTGNDDVRGEFVVDPSIRIPSSLLPPLGENETEDDRRNLSLMSKHGSVDAKIWLLPGSPLQGGRTTGACKPRRTTIALTSDHGSIHAQLHTLDGTAPFSLTGRTLYGTVRLALPRSFQGLISLSTRHGSISLSDPLNQNATQLSQLGTTRRYFVDDFQVLGEGTWDGDQVEIEAPHGSIRLKYVDEIVGVHNKKGLLSWLLGV